MNKRTTDHPSDNNVRMILKFDTGADGFMKMIYVLAIFSIIILVTGIIFLLQLQRDFSI